MLLTHGLARKSLKFWRRGRDFNSRTPCEVSGFQDRHVRPLRHPSIRRLSYPLHPLQLPIPLPCLGRLRLGLGFGGYFPGLLRPLWWIIELMDMVPMVPVEEV